MELKKVILIPIVLVLLVGCKNPGALPLIGYFPSAILPGWYEFSCKDKWIRNQWWSGNKPVRNTMIVPRVPTELDAIEACHARGLNPRDIIISIKATNMKAMNKWFKKNKYHIN